MDRLAGQLVKTLLNRAHKTPAHHRRALDSTLLRQLPQSLADRAHKAPARRHTTHDSTLLSKPGIPSLPSGLPSPKFTQYKAQDSKTEARSPRKRGQGSEPDLNEIAVKLIQRKCMMSRALRWVTLKRSYDDQATLQADEAERIQKIVVEIWEFDDAIETRAQDYNFIKKRLGAWASDAIARWTEEMHERIRRLKLFGLDYEILKAGCEVPGSGDETRHCMEEAARRHPWRDDVDPEQAVKDLRAHMDLEEFKLQRFPVHWGVKLWPRGSDPLFAHLEAICQESRKFLEEASLEPHFLYYEVQEECRKRTKQKQTKILKFRHDQLSAPTEQRDRSVPCEEKAGRYCPEGTAAVRKRIFNKVVATKAGLIAWFSYWGMFVLSCAVKFGMKGAKRGIGQMVAGIFFGISVGMCAPGCTEMSFLVSGITGVVTGTNECACFPRDCHYDVVEERCTIGDPYGDASKNPFARAFPYQGLKCVRHRKKEGVCRYEPCSTADFGAPRSSLPDAAVAQGLVARELYGFIGIEDGGVYNCLSKSPLPVDSLEVSRTLPEAMGGKNNTAEARVELFTDLGLKPHPDEPQAPRKRGGFGCVGCT